MSNKKDGWQQKIHDVFYQPKEEDANSGGVTNVQIPDQMPATPVARQSVQVPIDATETEKYVAQFRAAVEGSNEIGAKFIQVLYNLARRRFDQGLYREWHGPDWLQLHPSVGYQALWELRSLHRGFSIPQERTRSCLLCLRWFLQG